MSSRSSSNATPASGDDVLAHARGRRPESLADLVPGHSGNRTTVIPRQRSTTFFDDGLRRVDDELGGSDEARRNDAPRTQRRADGRGRRNSRPGRHSTIVRAGYPQPPITGTHRAPGTLPIESVLRVGRKRQQILLAGFVALGLLFVAVPAGQRRAGVNAVDTAAQRAIGVRAGNPVAADAHAATEPATHKRQAAPVPSAAASAPAKPTPTNKETTAGKDGMGPADSLQVTGTKAVALTFDDGPDPQQTPKILALLAKYHVKATFCLVGTQVVKYPQIVKQIAAAGNSLCDLTWNRTATIGSETTAQIRADMEKTNAAIQAAAPGAPVSYFRAPGGVFTDALVKAATSEGMTSLAWQVDPQDTDHPAGETDLAHVQKIIASVRATVEPGSIVLCHDQGEPDTVAAINQLLPWLTANFTMGLPAVPLPADPTPSSTPSPSATTTPAPAVTTTAPDDTPATDQADK